MTHEYVIEMREITKKFGDFVANDKINLQLRKGEIHALLGENGAGKSTLMNMLAGLLEPTSGDIVVNGKTVNLDSPSKAASLGIGMVHQHFMLVEAFTVAENIILGSETTKHGILDLKKASQDILDLSKKYGLAVDPNAKVEDISVGAQQRVEILKTLYRGADILIFDEPTAVLTPAEIEELQKRIEAANLELGATQAFEGLNEKVQSALEEAEHARHENEEVVEVEETIQPEDDANRESVNIL